jgi:enoyl-CoA hydratase
MSEEPKVLLVARNGPVATIILNRPHALNALNARLLRELEAALAELGADPEVRLLVITGAGSKAFCAGADLTELAAKTPEEGRALASWIQRIFNAVEGMRKPVLAKIQGFCLAGGFELAMACDFRIAADTAVFGQPEVNLGMVPGAGGTKRLPRLIGKTKALELLMTGERINAAEAARLGLINAVVPVEQLDQAVDEFVAKLLSKSPVALGIIKDTVTRGLELDLEQALAYEADQFGAALRTEDAREGLGAFMGKRKPAYKGS